jgi:hypothetical protein
MSKDLNPQKALIFRIIHRENVADMFRDGLQCRNAASAMRPFVQIGNPGLIERRLRCVVDCPPGGTLADYVPFYFTPYSPMMYNIFTGYSGIVQRPRSEIIVMVSSLHHLNKMKIPFVFSDRHAVLKWTQFSSNLSDLDRIDWASLQARNFKKDDADRFERYQAEALVHSHMPITGLLGIACFNDVVRFEVETLAQKFGHNVTVQTMKNWYL